MPIEWNNVYLTGFEKIDEQHKKLFECVNRMEVLVFLDPIPQEEIQKLLKFLETYVSEHFLHEEACMLQEHCPNAEENKKAHREFLAFFQKALAEYEENVANHDWLEVLYKAAGGWIINHICKVDIKLRSCQHSKFSQETLDA